MAFEGLCRCSGGGGDAPASGARVARTTALAVPSTSWVPVPFQSTITDTDGYHSTTVDTERLTVPADRLYLVQAKVQFGTSVNEGSFTLIEAWITVDGAQPFSSFIDWDEGRAIGSWSGEERVLSLSTIVALEAGQYVETYVRHLVEDDNPLDLDRARFEIAALGSLDLGGACT